MLPRLAIAMFLACAGLLFFGGKSLLIEASASPEPQSISVEAFQKGIPDNRHVLITGAMADLANTIKLTRTRKGSSSSTILYFVPLWNPASPGKRKAVAIVKMAGAEFEAQRGKGFDFGRVQGMRVTDYDFDSKAKEALVKEYGKEAVDKIPIIAWNQKPGGTLTSYLLLGGGVLCLGLGIVFLRAHRNA